MGVKNRHNKGRHSNIGCPKKITLLPIVEFLVRD